MLKPPFLAVGKVTLTILRRGAGAYVLGRYVEDSASTEIEITANVQPGLKWNDLQHLPEGERGRKSLRVYTDFPLRTRQEGAGGHDADRFVWTDGHTYEVNILCHRYEVGPLQHTKAICSRVEVT